MNFPRSQIRKIIFKRILLPLLLVTVTSCSSVKPNPLDFKKADLKGIVFGSQGAGIFQAKICTENVNQDQTCTESDYSGRFSLPQIEKGEHVLTVSAVEHETRQQKIFFSNLSQAVFVHMLSWRQMLTNAKKYIISNEYAAANHWIQRAKSVAPTEPLVSFHMAILAFKKNDMTMARQLAQETLSLQAGLPSPAVQTLISEIDSRAGKDD
ncbi:MAG: carboxypeptidase regulatory-like domain-containing protein [Spirochaetaceae bacterium]|nr:MAG: carboxypeptidase regulatory-like domain-containing protein [Spirochaetaceae bacterium]